MTVTFYGSIGAAIDALDQLFVDHWDLIPEATRDELWKLRGLGVSPVDRIVNTAERIYACIEDMPEEAKAVAAGLFRIAELNGFHGMQDGSRGSKAASVLEGDEIADPPEPKPEFSPQPPPTPFIPIVPE